MQKDALTRSTTETAETPKPEPKIDKVRDPLQPTLETDFELMIKLEAEKAPVNVRKRLPTDNDSRRLLRVIRPSRQIREVSEFHTVHALAVPANIAPHEDEDDPKFVPLNVRRIEPVEGEFEMLTALISTGESEMPSVKLPMRTPDDKIVVLLLLTPVSVRHRTDESATQADCSHEDTSVLINCVP